MYHSGHFCYPKKGQLMNTEPRSFEHLTRTVRTEELDGEPWFHLSDICESLGLYIKENGKPDVKLAAQNIPDDEKTQFGTLFEGEYQDVIVVTPTGFVRLIMRSNKKEAKELQNFVISLIPQNTIEALITL